MKRLTNFGIVTQADIDKVDKNELYFQLQYYENLAERDESLYEKFVELVKITGGDDVCND